MDYAYGAGDTKRPEPDGSDAAIDSEGPSLTAIAGKSPLVLPTRDARFYISTVIFQVRLFLFEIAIINIVFMESTGREYHFSGPKKWFRGSGDRIRGHVLSAHWDRWPSWCPGDQ